MAERSPVGPGARPRLGLPLSVLLLLAIAGGCPSGKGTRDGGAGPPPVRPPIDPGRISSVETRVPLPAGEPVVDDQSGVRVPVPEGWAAYQLDSVPSLVVRLERAAPPAMRIDVHRGSDRAPDGSERFFDRGPYLGNGRSEDVIGVWAERDPQRPGTWRFGVLLQDNGRSAVIEGWLPDEDFEAAKRSFDALVEATHFVEGDGS